MEFEGQRPTTDPLTDEQNALIDELLEIRGRSLRAENFAGITRCGEAFFPAFTETYPDVNPKDYVLFHVFTGSTPSLSLPYFDIDGQFEGLLRSLAPAENTPPSE